MDSHLENPESSVLTGLEFKPRENAASAVNGANNSATANKPNRGLRNPVAIGVQAWQYPLKTPSVGPALGEFRLNRIAGR